MSSYTQLDCELPHWKCVMWYSSKYPRVNIPDQETDDQYSDTIASIIFHIYNLIARCSTRERLPLNDKNKFRKCKQDSASENPKKCTLEKS